ncbi:DNA double-strand break repair nuclease NurA [Candidatus Micrarchaeota archaeon]|nr:DNA double-strand break repair nuclease NurA [Candidatus Micrarchaeota archaeon]
MQEILTSFAKDIRETHNHLREKAKQARNPQLIKTVQKCSIDLSVCAVDGGLLSYRVHGTDIIMARAVGVIFTYENSRLKSFEYYPGKKPSSSVEYRDTLDEHEANVFRSLVRLKHELTCAVNIFEKYSPQLMLIDGSLLPLPNDRPSDVSVLLPMYDEIISLYEKLFSQCQDSILCGVIKDSRSKKLTKDLDLNCSDTLFCNYFLEAGERTNELQYSDAKPSKDLAKLYDQVKVFYLKASANDLPLRIETISDVDKAASSVHSLSSISDRFAYPAVLIEADMCAAFDRKDAESLETALSNLNPLRRNSRPFR